MPRKRKRILVLYDLPEIVDAHQNIAYISQNNDRPTERDVVRTLSQLGHDTFVHGIYDDLEDLIRRVRSLNVDVVFNLCETYCGSRRFEGDIASIFNLLGVPFTGSSPQALTNCKDKSLSKKIAKLEGIDIPQFEVFPVASAARLKIRDVSDLFFGEKISKRSGRNSWIVKPIDLEASEGISKASLVSNPEDCIERIRWVAERYSTDVIVEEFIQGREIYVGVLETKGELIALPPRELFIHRGIPTEPLIATYKVKWDEQYRERLGIETGPAKGMSDFSTSRLALESIRVFKSLKLRGYARVDWRLRSNESPVFLEVNPNPALAANDDLALAASDFGILYRNLISSIIETGISSANQSDRLGLFTGRKAG